MNLDRVKGRCRQYSYYGYHTMLTNGLKVTERSPFRVYLYPRNTCFITSNFFTTYCRFIEYGLKPPIDYTKVAVIEDWGEYKHE